MKNTKRKTHKTLASTGPADDSLTGAVYPNKPNTELRSPGPSRGPDNNDNFVQPYGLSCRLTLSNTYFPHDAR